MKTHASPFVGRIGGLRGAVLTGLTVALVSVAPRVRASDLHRYAQSNAVGRHAHISFSMAPRP